MLAACLRASITYYPPKNQVGRSACTLSFRKGATQVHRTQCFTLAAHFYRAARLQYQDLCFFSMSIGRIDNIPGRTLSYYGRPSYDLVCVAGGSRCRGMPLSSTDRMAVQSVHQDTNTGPAFQVRTIILREHVLYFKKYIQLPSTLMTFSFCLRTNDAVFSFPALLTCVHMMPFAIRIYL